MNPKTSQTPSHRRIVVTGMGAVSAFGVGADLLIAACCRGEQSIAPIRTFAAAGLPLTIGSGVDRSLLPPDPHFHGTASRMAHKAAQEALQNAQLEPQRDNISLASAIGWEPPPLHALESEGFSDALIETWRQSAAYPESQPDQSSQNLYEALHCTGPLLTDHAACASGLHSIIHAARLILSGRTERCLAGASDTRLHPIGILGYARLGVLNTHDNHRPELASRPFNADRQGFIIGEGAGYLVLESLRSAQSRGVPILGELSGWALATDGENLTHPITDGARAASCILTCLRRANCSPSEVDYINAHGTSTPPNDLMECRAYQNVFKNAPSPAISSSKSMIGHLSMASAAVESIITLGAMNRSMVPPTLNLTEPDSACHGLDFIGPTPVPRPIHTALKTAFGLGGQNAAVLWKKWLP